ncbi:FHA domain-containing protein [Egbenema bharatensis]|uniref:FHA domain-containing protein n=1 Tax=Egbenema bharatensis TaxID=3463334 RepID=UPI003A87175D
MPDLDSFHAASQTSLPLEQTALSDQLLAECNYDLKEVSALMEPLRNAPQRCQQTGRYIQAIATQCTGFIATNLGGQAQLAEVTPMSSTWLVGRSEGCTIQLQHRTISRRHAVIGRYSFGFYIADLGSLNGTWVNQHRLEPARRIVLEDGDLIQFGMIKVEFFLAKPEFALLHADETAVC